MSEQQAPPRTGQRAGPQANRAGLRWQAAAGSRPGRLGRLAPALAAMAVLALASACGGASSGTAAPAAAASSGQPLTIAARSLPGVGTVLVTGEGYALYIFTPDKHKAVTCTGACAGTWPPLTLPPGAALAAGPGVKKSLLGSIPEPGGLRVVTYAGWPLYGYSGDIDPGQATGQDVDLNGGYWYVMRPSGQPLEAAS